MHPYGDIPAELTSLNQWVCWNMEGDAKIPYNANTGTPASTTDSRSWTAFEQAVKAAAEHEYSGIGYVFRKDDPYTGIDLDDCLRSDGSVTAWAQAILARFRTYTEVSPRGKGLKLWVKGAIPAAITKRETEAGGGIEMYSTGRYFTVTGQRWKDSPSAIVEGGESLVHIFGWANGLPKFGKAKPASPETRQEKYVAAALNGVLSDVREAASGSRNIDLNAAAFRLGQFAGRGLIDYDDARGELEAAGTALGLPLREVRATIKSGLRGGLSKSSDLKLPDFTPHGPATVPTFTPVANPGRFVNAAELYLTEFEEPIWAVADILSEGVTMLAGPPKVKKSWLALLLGYCVSTGQPFLGKYDVTQGDVLFYDLESTTRRVKGRLRSMLTRSDLWPETLWFATECGRGDAAFEDFEQDLAAHPNTRVMIIDILARIRAPRRANSDIYEEDYNLIQRLNALAYKHRIAIVVVHHTRKAKAEYAFDEISGSRGIHGGAGASWMLRRLSGTDAQLLVEGRDIVLSDDEEAGIALSWNRDAARFMYAGSAQTYKLSDERKRILAVLSDDETHSLKDIAAGIGRTVSTTGHLLKKMIADGHVDRLEQGSYARILRGVQNDQSIQSVQSVQSVQYRYPSILNDTPTILNGHSKSIPHPNAPNRDFEHFEHFVINQIERGGTTRWQIWDAERSRSLGIAQTRDDAIARGKQVTGESE